MPSPLLEPSPRRRWSRRRRRRRRAALLVLLLAACATGGWYLGSGRAGSRPAPHPADANDPATPVRASAQQGPVSGAPALLVAGDALRSHRFHRLGAEGAILVDGETGAVLWRHASHARLPIASTTKIMTATLVLEHRSLGHVVTVAPRATRVQPFREGLRPGEQVPVRKLLYGLLLFSGNDDAVALAVDVGGTPAGFEALMNAKARELGLADTRFDSPNGLRDRGNYSTAWDLAALTRYALRNRTFREIVRTRIKRVRWPAPTFAKVYVNKNHLLTTYRGADGVKTGWTTKAEHCIVASARRDGVHLIAVALGSPNAYRDARRILNWGFATRG